MPQKFQYIYQLTAPASQGTGKIINYRTQEYPLKRATIDKFKEQGHDVRVIELVKPGSDQDLANLAILTPIGLSSENQATIDEYKALGQDIRLAAFMQALLTQEPNLLALSPKYTTLEMGIWELAEKELIPPEYFKKATLL